MAQRYTVRQHGLMLDLILWRRYGRRGEPLVGLTLSNNPGLAELGPILPMGTVILLPDLPKPGPFVATSVSLFS